MALDISKAFDRVWHAGLLHKLKSYEISGQIFGLISSFLSNRWFWVVLGGKSSQEYPVHAGIPQGSIVGPKLFLVSLMTFLMMLSVILLSMLMILTIWSGATTRIGLLRDTVEWCRKWLVDFNAGRTHLVSFDRSDNTGAIDVKMDGSVLEEKSPFKILGLTWGSYIISIAKNVPKKIGALIPSMKFVSPEVALYLC